MSGDGLYYKPVAGVQWRMRRPAAAATGFTLLLTAAAAYWLWYGLTQRSIVEDDGISLLAAQGIIRHGLPLLPSGALYHRGYLPHYLLAGSMAVFGTNNFGIMAVSWLFMLGVLYLTYRAGADLFQRPWAGLMAAMWMAGLQLNAFYATSPRMYAALQFFCLLAAYGAWRAFVDGERAFRWPTAAAVAGAILSHQQGGVLLGALPVAVLAGRAAKGMRLAEIPWRWVVPVWAGLCALFYAASIYHPPGTLMLATAAGDAVTKHRQINVDIAVWARHVKELDRIAPLGFLLVPAAAWAATRGLERAGGPWRAAAFVAALVGVSAAAVMATTRSTYQRFWFYTLPSYLLLLTVSASLAWGAWRSASRPQRAVAAAVAGAWLMFVFFALGTPGIRRAVRHARFAYGPPCAEGECMASTAQGYRRLRDALAAGDMVIATNPWTAAYYVGRVDGVLRERRLKDGRYTAFDRPVEEYFSAPIIDTPEELRDLLASPGRVWVIADKKLDRSNSQPTRDHLARDWTLAYARDRVRIYANRDERIAASP
jgi:hypothetical protein